MNLAWLAATFRPRDVAPHPNFSEVAEDGARILASVLLEEDFRLEHQRREANQPSILEYPDPAIGLIKRAFHRETLTGAVTELAAALTSQSDRSEDPARGAALSVIACCAASERDDYETCFEVLEAQLSAHRRPRHEDGRLVRATLLQQLAIRQRDAGLDPKEAASEVLRLTEALDPLRCTAFRVTAGVSWTYAETLSSIIEALRDAAFSLFASSPANSEALPPAARTWQEGVRAPAVEMLLRTENRRADVYSDFVSQAFKNRLQARESWSFGGPRKPDLFYSTLAYELLGHRRVYGARADLAKLRFVQAVSPDERAELDDAVRLLRQSTQAADLEVALRWIRAGGPLSALSGDARQIIQHRLTRDRLRTVELAVLRDAAELLTPAEGATALTALVESLRAGGPHDLPGHLSALVTRLEPAWIAAAALANTAERTDEVASLLLSVVVPREEQDQLLDMAIARAISWLEWTHVSSAVRNAWDDWLRQNAAAWSYSAEAIARELKLGHSSTSGRLADVVTLVNTALGGQLPSSERMQVAVDEVAAGMTRIREAAQAGSHSFGGVTEAELASGLVLYAGNESLWAPLAAFLADPSVHRTDKSASLERLARDCRSVPDEATAILRLNSEVILASSVDPFESGLVPYPPALRFLGALDILDENEVLTQVATLQGIPIIRARQEAALTLASFARRRSSPWLHVAAMQLSYDPDMEVRAYSGQALALIALAGEGSVEEATTRVVALMDDDGLLIPYRILGALSDVGSSLPRDVVQRVERLGEDHPSRLVRLRAQDILRSLRNGGSPDLM